MTVLMIPPPKTAIEYNKLGPFDQESFLQLDLVANMLRQTEIIPDAIYYGGPEDPTDRKLTQRRYLTALNLCGRLYRETLPLPYRPNRHKMPEPETETQTSFFNKLILTCTQASNLSYCCIGVIEHPYKLEPFISDIAEKQKLKLDQTTCHPNSISFLSFDQQQQQFSIPRPEFIFNIDHLIAN